MKPKNLLLYLLLIILSIPFVFPFWWMVVSSLKSPFEIFVFPPTFLPRSWRWENYVEAFRFLPFARHYWNSMYIAVLVTTGTLLISSLAGYAFARIRFKASNVLFVLLLSTLILPVEVTIIPNFLFMQKLGLLNTHIPLILIPIAGTSGVIATFIMRQHMLSLPEELEDAGKIDGLNQWGIYWRIAVPLARPALSTIAVLTFLHSWNSFLEPLVYVNDLKLFTLPLSLASFTDSYGTPLWHIQLAATTLSVLPVLIAYIIAQRHFVESLALSGIKG